MKTRFVAKILIVKLGKRDFVNVLSLYSVGDHTKHIYCVSFTQWSQSLQISFDFQLSDDSQKCLFSLDDTDFNNPEGKFVNPTPNPVIAGEHGNDRLFTAERQIQEKIILHLFDAG